MGKVDRFLKGIGLGYIYIYVFFFFFFNYEKKKTNFFDSFLYFHKICIKNFLKLSLTNALSNLLTAPINNNYKVIKV